MGEFDIADDDERSPFDQESLAEESLEVPPVTNPAPNTGELHPGPRGGMLRRGGSPGRTPDAVRRRAFRMLDRRMEKVLGAVADGKGEGVKARDQVAAMKVLHDIATGPAISMTDVRKRLQETLEFLQTDLPEADARRVMAKLEQIWSNG